MKRPVQRDLVRSMRGQEINFSMIARAKGTISSFCRLDDDTMYRTGKDGLALEV